MKKLIPGMEKSACRHRLNAISDALYAIGGKWRLQIIVAMLEGTNRFNELQRSIEGISSKVLASELKDLEMNGFIRRQVIPGPPVIVQYELTGYSHSLTSVLDALYEWGSQHKVEVKRGFANPQLEMQKE
ncbi:MAG TPA: helix-turn-helix domain-containing protein [Saprospiraceae bacterium]|jgi:DNA-binding HxlR family transcriptional regulator